MNIFKVSAIALATVIALTGCGGSKSSSGSDNKKDKKPESGESRDPELIPQKRAVYTSPTCMDETEIKNAGIELSGITLKKACLNKDSTKDHFVIEGPVASKIKFVVSEDLQLTKLANNYLVMYKKDPSLLNDDKDCIKSVRPSVYSDSKWNEFIASLKSENLTSIKNSIKDLTLDQLLYIEPYIETKQQVTLTSYISSIDFSFEVKFREPGEYRNIKHELRSRYKIVENKLKPYLTRSSREQLAAAVSPLTAKISFLIKEPDSKK